MPGILINGATIDDLTKEAIDRIFAEGSAVAESTEGANTELLAVTLHLTNPRARLSRTETRARPSSCLGELCWYLSGSAATDQITYYIGLYRKYDEAGTIFGAYGPRLLAKFGTNQLDNVVNQLTKKPATRQAVIQVFSAMDLSPSLPPVPEGKKRDIPCTCLFQFFIRDGLLHMVTYMRSNDAFFGLTHDCFCFTMMQEIIARRVGAELGIDVELGTYTHIAGSLHIYEKHRDKAMRTSAEGWQPTNQAMPSMPVGDPMPSIQRVLEAERRFRKGETVSDDFLHGVDDYWADLIRLLRVYSLVKKRDVSAIESVRGEMKSQIYDFYLRRALNVAAP